MIAGSLDRLLLFVPSGLGNAFNSVGRLSFAKSKFVDETSFVSFLRNMLSDHVVAHGPRKSASPKINMNTMKLFLLSALFLSTIAIGMQTFESQIILFVR